MKNMTKLAVIGAGAMAEAVIGGLIKNELITGENITAAEPVEERRAYLRSKYAVRVTAENREALEEADVVLLSVKPQILPAVFDELAGQIPTHAFILSIVAGVTIKSIQSGFNHQKIIRTMPNTPAQVGCGMTVWTASQDISENEKEIAQQILKSLGVELYVDDEKYLDMATAVSGSGPAYVFLFLEALIDAGVQIGMSRSMAEMLAAQTILGSTEYYLEKNTHPAQLRNQVTSPAGTTAEAIYQLEKGGLRTTVTEAVMGAYRRCLELGKGE